MTKMNLQYHYHGRLWVSTQDILIWLKGNINEEAFEKIYEAFKKAEDRAEEEL